MDAGVLLTSRATVLTRDEYMELVFIACEGLRCDTNQYHTVQGEDMEAVMNDELEEEKNGSEGEGPSESNNGVKRIRFDSDSSDDDTDEGHEEKGGESGEEENESMQSEKDMEIEEGKGGVITLPPAIFYTTESGRVECRWTGKQVISTVLRNLLPGMFIIYMFIIFF